MEPLKAIETFHLALLGVLQTRLDQRIYILKGGANLRYFFGSPRFSEDIDFDVKDIPKARLDQELDRVLDSRALEFILRSQKIGVTEVTKPKQTETTQRWKVRLSGPPGMMTVRTSVEFSRRAGDDRYQLDQIPETVVAPYALPPATVSRYLPEAMIEFKIQALAQRAETQARDVFDLDLLFREYPGLAQSGALKITRRDLTAAADRALELPFEAYRSQVVAFLAPDVMEIYDRETAWSRIQEHVADVLTTMP